MTPDPTACPVNPDQITDEQLRMVCAESVGAKWVLSPHGTAWLTKSPFPDWTSCERPDDLTEACISNELPNYPGSVDACMELIGEAEKLGWEPLIYRRDELWSCYFDSPESLPVYGRDKHPARAICLAWLKLKGIEIK